MLAPAFAEDAQDAEGCKDHAAFTRMPGHHIYSCESSQFDMRAFPVGAPKPAVDDDRPGQTEVEGPTWTITYVLDEGATPASGLQIMRNFQNAARAAGGEVLGEYPGWCKAGYDSETMPIGNGCMNYSSTLKLARGGKEVWAFVQATDDGYAMVVSERQAMQQDVSVNELSEQLAKDGFVTLKVSFDTASTTLSPDSAAALDAAAAALEAAPDLRVEIAGHTDNVGEAAANQALSEGRAKSVAAALVARGIDGARMRAVGYGDQRPVGDNRTEAGRASNRRVEMTRL